jgi:ABC-2 type transport system ATP-binding protein
LTRRCGSLLAVDHLALQVNEEEVFGLLGPNGAGKTTTIRMLSCLTSPSESSGKVAGHDVVKEATKVREIVGIPTENPSLYERLTAYENMDFFVEAYNVSDPQERHDRIRNLRLLRSVGTER